MAGYYQIDVYSPFPSISDGFGSSYSIGDGVVLTAGHNIYFINYREDVGDRTSIQVKVGKESSGGSNFNVILEVRPYKLSLTQNYFAHEHIAYSSDETAKNIASIKAVSKTEDMILVEKGGDVNSSNAGTIVFLDPNDMTSSDYMLGATGDDVKVGRTSATTGTVTDAAVGNVGDNFFQHAVGDTSGHAGRGDSGSGMIVSFTNNSLGMHNKSFILGTLIYINNDSGTAADPRGAPYSLYFAPDDNYAIMAKLAETQAGNVTSDEPTNLTVGTSGVDGAIGSYRADIILGRDGDDVLLGEAIGTPSAWGNDQLFGGQGDDLLYGGRGSDLLHGGDSRTYSGTRKQVGEDGRDTVSYTDTLYSSGIEIELGSIVVTGSGTTDFSNDPDFSHALTIDDLAHAGDVDFLISVEKIDGTDVSDTLKITDLVVDQLGGADELGGLATVDLKGQSAGSGDLVDASSSTARLLIDLSGNSKNVRSKDDKTGEKVLTVLGAERAWGGTGNDTIKGDSHANELKGGAGADLIYAGNGDTVLEVDAGDAIYWGETHLKGGSRLSDNVASEGLSGSYTASYSNLTYVYDEATKTLIVQKGSESFTITDFENGEAGITLKNRGATNQAEPNDTDKPPTGSDPLVLDLDGDGIELTNVESQPVYFDINDDGFADRVGWVASDDGLLAQDLDGDGRISKIGELFGTATIDGFRILANYDSNHDGVINASDEVWAKLRIWRDADVDGDTDAGELKYLVDYGITSISLDAEPVNQGSVNNLLAFTGTYQLSSGAVREVAAVFFQTRLGASTDLENVDYPDAVYKLPELNANGLPLTLRGAAASDSQLLGMLQELVTSARELNSVEFRAAFVAVLLRWAGVDGINPLSRGAFADAQHIAFLEKLQNSPSYIRTSDGLLIDGARSPVLGPVLESAFDEAVNRLLLRFGSELATAEILSGVDANGTSTGWFAGLFNGTSHYDSGKDRVWGDAKSIGYGIGQSALLMTDKLGYLEAVSPFVQGLQELPNGFSYGYSWSSIEADFGNGLLLAGITDAALIEFAIDRLHGSDRPIQIGTEVDDTLVAQSGASNLFRGGSTFLGGSGNDVLIGGEKADTYVYASGDGNDLISEVPDDESVAPSLRPVDRLLLVGFNREDIEVSVSLDNASDVVLTFVGGATITLAGQLTGTGIEEIVFANGDRATASDLANITLGAAISNDPDNIVGSRFNDVLDGLGGDDQIDGGLGNDRITGGAGDDDIVGNAGDDTYIYSAGDGDDEINITINDEPGFFTDAVVDFEVIEFHDIDPGDVTIRRLDPNRLVYEIGGSTPGSITIIAAANHRGIDEVRFDNGTIWGPAQIELKMLSDGATDGDDHLVGFDTPWWQSEEYGGQDELIGGKGDDILEGLSGRDTYRYRLGDGDDTIIDQNSYLGQNRLIFDDLLSSDVTYAPTGDGGKDLLITINRPEGGSVLLVNGLSWDTSGYYYEESRTVTGLIFADGSIVSILSIGAMLASAAETAGHDHIFALEGDDVIDGLGGDDVIFDLGGGGTVNGGEGNDTITAHEAVVIGGKGDDQIIRAGTFEYRSGDGHDTVGGVTSQTITLIDIDPADVSYAAVDGYSGKDLLIVIGGSEPGSIRLKGVWPQYGGHATYTIAFADGATVSTDAIAVSLVDEAGTAGNDVITGLADFQDVIEGRGGDDDLSGGFAADTYIYSAGDGDDTIHDDGDGYYTDTVLLHGISSSDVTVTNDAGDALLTFDIAEGGSIRLTDMFSASVKMRILFDDGTHWSSDELIRQTATFGANPAISGTTGNDTLTGSSQAETFEGGEGDDSIRSNGGHDIFIFNPGDGHDTVSYLSGLSIVRLGTTQDNVTVLESSTGGVEYKLRIESTGDTIALDYGRTPLIEFSDGSRWDEEDLLKRLMVEGTAGNDNVGGRGDLTEVFDLLGGTNDVIYGGGGDDTFIYRAGYGFLSVTTGQAIGGSQTKTLELHDIDPADVSLALERRYTDYGFMILPSNSVDLVIRFNNSAGSVRILGAFADNNPSAGSSLDRILFDDDTIWSVTDILSRATVLGTEVADTIYSTAVGQHIVRGGGGNDHIFLEPVDEVHWAKGDGDDLLEPGMAGGYAPYAGGWLVLDDVLLSEAVFSLDNNNLLITVGDEVITIVAQLQPSNYYYNENPDGSFEKLLSLSGLDGIRFSDDTTISREELFGLIPRTRSEYGPTILGSVWADTLIGSSDSDELVGIEGDDNLDAGEGDDSLWGGAGNDVLKGGAGNDQLKGGSGSDTYDWSLGDGNDEVDDSGGRYDGVDTVRLHGVESSDLRIERVVRATAEFPYDALRLTIISTGEVITIKSQFLIDYLASDFLSQFTGADWTGGYGDGGAGPTPGPFTLTDLARGIERIVLDDETVIDPFNVSGISWVFEGTDYDDQLVGTSGDDTFRESYGWDTIFGGAGADMAYFYGNAADARISVNPDGTVRVEGGISATLDSVEELHFLGDDTVINVSELPALGTSGADTIVGSARSDVLYGLGGDDAISPGAGNDTIDGGDGVDQVSYSGSLADYRVSRELDGSISVIQRVDPYKFDALFNVESIYFAGDDETVLVSSLPALGTGGDDVITGTDRGENLYGQEGNDTIDGQAGDDYISGGSGNDIIIAGAGNDSISGEDGHDTLIGGDGADYLDGGEGSDTYDLSARTTGFGDTFIGDYGSQSDQDTLLLPDADYAFAADGENLSITSTINSSSVTIGNVFGGNWGVGGVEVIDVNDGAELVSVHQGSNTGNVLTGGSGRDIISGLGGNDRVTGAGGDDLLAGGNGSDTFAFGTGFGIDTIADFAATGSSHDVLEFGTNEFADWTHLLGATAQVGNDLVITLDTANQVTLKNVALANFTSANATFV